MYAWFRCVSGDFWFIAYLSFREVMYYRRHGYTVQAVQRPKEVQV